MRAILTFVFFLFLSVTSFAQGFPWEKFKPRTIKDVISITTRAVRPDDSLFLATDLLESKMPVIFTGKSRPILKDRQTFISTWAGMLNYPKEYANSYRHEYLYKEGSDEYWLPTQEPITKYFDKELKEGDEMTLYLISTGAYRSRQNIDCVLLVEEYQK